MLSEAEWALKKEMRMNFNFSFSLNKEKKKKDIFAYLRNQLLLEQY